MIICAKITKFPSTPFIIWSSLPTNINEIKNPKFKWIEIVSNHSQIERFVTKLSLQTKEEGIKLLTSASLIWEVDVKAVPQLLSPFISVITGSNRLRVTH